MTTVSGALFCAARRLAQSWLLLIYCTVSVSVQGAVPDAVRVAEIMAALPEDPCGWGASAKDRAFWARAAKVLAVQDLLALAAAELEREPEPIPDSLFLRYSRDGNREEYQAANRRRLARLNLFAWAEAVEGEGRFGPRLRREVEMLLDEKTWVLPAHDPGLKNFAGRATEVDLMAAMKGWTIATIAFWHESALGRDLVERTHAELRRRLFAPYLARVQRESTSTRDGFWWIDADNNWNAVCHAGVVGAALASPESKQVRATLVAHAEMRLQSYLRGFTADGYCSEGIGYWNYGFGHFVMLSETLRRATGGRVSLVAGEHARRIAAYPWGLEILPGVFPAFADMRVDERPSTWFGELAQSQLGVGPRSLAARRLATKELATHMIYETAMKVFLPIMTEGGPAAPPPTVRGDHHWFAEAQVYTGRASPMLGAAIKGGHNAEHHNHNDVGSYVVAVEGAPVLVDPGSEIYTRRTFGPDRYVSQVLNSWGHPVPRVAGQLQSAGRRFAATVISASFAPAEDVIVLDLTAAYDVPALRSLVRTFTLRRGAAPEIIITDSVEYTEPSAFETALITFGRWEERAPDALRFMAGESALSVRIEASAPWTMRAAKIDEQLPGGRTAHRIGLELREPVQRGHITLTLSAEPGFRAVSVDKGRFLGGAR